MKEKVDSCVEVVAMELVEDIKELRSTLTMVPFEKPMSKYIEESILTAENFLTV